MNMHDDTSLEKVMDSTALVGDTHPAQNHLATETEVAAIDPVSQIQAGSLSRLASEGCGRTLKQDLVDVLVVATVISHPLG